jgi:hypothetical protein
LNNSMTPRTTPLEPSIVETPAMGQPSTTQDDSTEEIKEVSSV